MRTQFCVWAAALVVHLVFSGDARGQSAGAVGKEDAGRSGRSAADADVLPGQIVVDAEHPQWLMRQGGKHVFICGPGDPEGFLYLGTRRADGTRDGDQVARIEKLVKHGGNCLYLQVVRSHGGDAKDDRTQNPFVDSDPAKGLDEEILNQWEEWFALADRHGILIYLFIYDDSARIWNTGDAVGEEERVFVEGIVRKFKHHENLIWIVGEESEERYSTARVQALAEVIRSVDDHGHIVGTHHQSGTTFKAWRENGALDHFSMQFTATGDAAHAGAIEALKKAAGRYQVIYAESTETPIDVDGVRRHAWAVAMAGLMPMLIGMDIVSTPPESLAQCRYLSEFFEATDFWTMKSHDELRGAGTKYVLADPGRSYIAYADGTGSRVGVKAIPAGRWAWTWLDCVTGKTATGEAPLPEAREHGFTRPEGVGAECAVWIRRVGRETSTAAEADAGGQAGEVYFPPPDAEGGWRTLSGDEEIRRVAGLDRRKLDEALAFEQSTKNGGLVVVRHGWLVYERYFGKGHRDALCNLASCGKSFTSIGVGMLMAERPELFPDGLDQKIFTPTYFPAEAFPLSDPRKAEIKLGQLLSFSAGIRGNNPSYVDGKPVTIEPAGPDGWQALVDEITLGKRDVTLGGRPISAATLWCAPGGGYSYATASIHNASIMLRHVTGRELQDYLDEKLARPLGWGRWTFAYKSAKEVTHTPGGGGIALRATDMLRFGYLLLNEGHWNDGQIVPAEYVRHCRSQSPYNPHYPYSLQFNVNTDGHESRLPRDAFWKTGSGYHCIYVVPSLDLVVWKLAGRDSQYGPGDTGMPVLPHVASAQDDRADWKASADPELRVKPLELVIGAIVEGRGNDE